MSCLSLSSRTLHYSCLSVRQGLFWARLSDRVERAPGPAPLSLSAADLARTPPITPRRLGGGDAGPKRQAENRLGSLGLRGGSCWARSVQCLGAQAGAKRDQMFP